MEALGLILGWEPPLAAELSALALVGLVIRWFMQRENTDDSHTLERIAALEAKVTHLEERMSAERTAKHEALAAAASYRGTLRVVQFIGEDCTCGVFSKLSRLLDEALEREL